MLQRLVARFEVNKIQGLVYMAHDNEEPPERGMDKVKLQIPF